MNDHLGQGRVRSLYLLATTKNPECALYISSPDPIASGNNPT